MEIKFDKRYPIDASVSQCWAVLSDVRATAACMPGAQITEQIDDTHYKGTVRSKVGPAVMVFNGNIEVRTRDAAAMSLDMTGKGTDRTGSSASMNLAARVEAADAPGTALLVGIATFTVSGKLAQFGNRLLGPVSEAMLAQFADNFRAAAAAVAGATGTATMAATPPAPGEAVAASAPHATAPQPVTELRPLALLWLAIRRWFARLFGRHAE